jgi:alpha-D-xyloside xylohydrolase
MGLRERPVYLPSGVRWVNVWTGDEHDGGQTLAVEAPLSHIPVFARAGSDVIASFQGLPS